MTAPTRPTSHPALIGILIILGLVSGAASISVWAQPGGEPNGGYWERGVSAEAAEGRGPGGPPPRGHPLLALFDTDQDGVISAKEIDQAAVILISMDADGDSAVSEDELVQALPPPPGHPMGRQGGRGMGPPPGADF